MRVLVQLVTLLSTLCAAFPLYPFYSSTPADLSVTWNADSIQHEFNRRHQHYNVPVYEHRGIKHLPLLQASNQNQNYNHHNYHHHNHQDQASKKDAMRFSEIVNANHLRNPCQTNSKPAKSTNNVDNSNRALVGLFKELISKAHFVKGFTERIIKLNQIEECSQLELPYIANVPTIAMLNELPSIEARLQTIYKSLLNQTMHSYFIWEKQRKNVNDSCTFHNRKKAIEHRKRSERVFSGHTSSSVSTDMSTLAQYYYTIAVNFKDLMCLFTQATQAMNTEFNGNKIINSILNHTIIDVKLCSRRAVRDCQVLKSSLILLDTLKHYFQNKSEYSNVIS